MVSVRHVYFGQMRQLYIFDLDGTLARIDHRKHLLDDKEDSNRWRKFYALCDRDEPNLSVIFVMEMLRAMNAEVWIFSGRSDEVRDKTVEWIKQYSSFTDTELETALVMRQAHDHRPDDELKQQFLDRMLEIDRKRLIAVFDDRDRVVKMWRENGVTCFQVAAGDF